jgi:hypothetical protein
LRARLAACVLTLALIASASSTALAQSTGSRPTSGQIAAAVRKVERSRDLWATVNICKLGPGQLTLGIRGQMPALGFATTMAMNVQAEYLSGQRFVPIANASAVVSPGSAAQGLHQDGANFHFTPYNGILSGEITFTWRLGGKVLAKLTRPATGGHSNADFASPPHFSTARCQG